MIILKQLAWFLVYTVLISNNFWINCTGSKETANTEFSLRSELLKNYSPSILPSFNGTTPLEVKLGLAVRQIHDVDEKNQVIIINIWFRQYWKDYILQWNVSDYENVRELHFTKKEVWVPDIALYNTASDNGILYKRLDTQIVVNHEGNASWLTPVQVKSECKINVKYFPFDEQICKLTFGSWTFHGGQVDLFSVSESADLSNFVENTEWELIDAPFTKIVEYYDCCPHPYPSLTVHIRIRRRALFYLSNLVIPCGVIALMASLAFFLPSDNGERISLVVTVLLSLTVYMLIVSETMPPTSDVVPLIGKFYISTMILIALTLVAVCITLNCCEKEARMPQWLRRVLLDYLARFVCVSCGSQATNAIGASASTDSENRTKLSLSQAFVVTNGIIASTKPSQDSASLGHTKDENQLPTYLLDCDNDSKKRSSEDITSHSKHGHGEDEYKLIKAEWKIASCVLDRIFFLMFLFTFIVMSVIVFSEAPHISLS